MLIMRNTYTCAVKANQPSWPPQSAKEALLSSPSGRRKYEQRRERTSVSPSPSKRRPLSREAPPSDDEEEDEETLQLKLQAIEAKLKLKKLQQAKKAAAAGETDSNASSSRSGAAQIIRKLELPRADSKVEVPHSPVRIRREPEEQKSPARVILGIDKGWTARDVSLKRPGGNIGGGLSRASSVRTAEPPKIKSFSERIAESRNKEKEREEKEIKIEARRGRGFGLQNIEGVVDRSTPRTGSSLSTTTRGSQDMLPPKTLNRTQSRSTSDLRNPPTPRPGFNRAVQSDDAQSMKPAATPTATKYAEIASRDDSSDAPSFESFSGLHLKKRTLQHNVVARTLEGKTVFTLPQLLKSVKAPEYDPPDLENEYVVLGVICHKSNPYKTKNAAQDQSKGNDTQDSDSRNNFMVIKLTDFKWEIDLFLFDTGFSQFWKLPLGTLVAILNPDIMPPRKDKTDTGKFSLKLSSSDDTILELGVARDLDFCHAHRKDGKQCETWIDARKTEVCEFHLGLQMEKVKKGRMEINTMVGMGRGPRGGGGGGKFGMFGGGRGGGAFKGDDLKREGKYHDRELHETVYIAPRPGGAARAIDRDEQSWERGSSREEKWRRQLAEKEKEKDLAKKLGQMGDGTAGGDYLRLKGSGTQNLPARGYTSMQDSRAGKVEKPPEADFSSLLNRTSADVSMAPVKRKRIASGKSSVTTSEPVGWGKSLKYGRIPSPKKEIESAMRGTREPSPAKKKARLLLPEKGIREPGRDSLGGLDIGLIAAMDEDDDDLEVI